MSDCMGVVEGPNGVSLLKNATAVLLFMVMEAESTGIAASQST